MLEIAEKDILQSLERDNPWGADTGSMVGADFAHTRAYFNPSYGYEARFS